MTASRPKVARVDTGSRSQARSRRLEQEISRRQGARKEWRVQGAGDGLV